MGVSVNYLFKLSSLVNSGSQTVHINSANTSKQMESTLI